MFGGKCMEQSLIRSGGNEGGLALWRKSMQETGADCKRFQCMGPDAMIQERPALLHQPPVLGEGRE